MNAMPKLAQPKVDMARSWFTRTAARAGVPQAHSARVRPLALVHLRGSQAEMGEQHGRLLKAVGGYEEAFEFYQGHCERTFLAGLKGVRRRVARRAFGTVERALLGRLERSRPKALRERTRAFTEALGYSERLVRYTSVVDVFQNLVGTFGRLGVGPLKVLAGAGAVPACSSVVVWGDASADGTLRHARNFDFPGIGVWDRSPAVVFCDPDEGLRYGFVATRGVDAPGITAFNEAGLTITAHTRFHKDIAWSGLSVVDLGHEIIRRAETLADALAIAKEQPIASSWGFCISSASERAAGVLETTAKRAVLHTQPAPKSSDSAHHLTCANRFHHQETRPGEVSTSPLWRYHSARREARLTELVERASEQGGLTRKALGEALGDRFELEGEDRLEGAAGRGCGATVCNPITVQSIVHEPEAKVLHVSVGHAPTSFGPWVSIPWTFGQPVGLRQLGDPPERGAATDSDRAYERFVEAARLYAQEEDESGALEHLEAALALVPLDPGYRFLAGGIALGLGQAQAALGHLEVARAQETGPHRRALCSLWAARAATAAGDPELARDLCRATLAIEGAEAAPYRELAARELDRPLTRRRLSRSRVNLFLVDAFA
jgi:hypothetical protein